MSSIPRRQLVAFVVVSLGALSGCAVVTPAPRFSATSPADAAAPEVTMREGLPRHEDPGWYNRPAGTVASKVEI